MSIVPILSEGYSRAKLFIDYFSWPCELFKNAHACALRDCLGVSRPFVSDTSPKCIDREGLKRRRTGTSQIITIFIIFITITIVIIVTTRKIKKLINFTSCLCCFSSVLWVSLSRTVGGDGEGTGTGGESELWRFTMCLILALGDVLCDWLFFCVSRGLFCDSGDISSTAWKF